MQVYFLSGLVLAAIFVNGWTDAPNSITTVVATGTLSFRRAALLAALCDLAGVFLMSLLCPTVAETVFTMVDFGNDTAAALTALQAALLSIVLWAVLAWRFGIPTSESHALISGLTGSAIALHGGLDGVSASAWLRVLAGLLLSTVCGALAGSLAARTMGRKDRSSHRVRRGQLLCAGAMAFFHGTQDGQKFLALLLLVRALARGETVHHFSVSPSLSLLCAAVMGCGVLCGGKRIIRTVSQGMGRLSQQQGLAVDLAGSACLFAASLLGLPVSTTHTKVSAMLGAGLNNGSARSGYQAAFRIGLAWLATFPCCGLLSWFLTRLML